MKNKFIKIVLIIVVLLVCGLTACRTGKPAEKSDASREFEASDEFKIEAAVYGYLLERNFSDRVEYSAIFLEGSDAWVAALIRKFPNHVPPIKPSNRMQLHPNQTPIDEDTGKPAMILSAKAMEPTNDVSEAIGTWYAGGALSGMYAFVLVKADGEWAIQSAK
jgi:hypothetical protein